MHNGVDLEHCMHKYTEGIMWSKFCHHHRTGWEQYTCFEALNVLKACKHALTMLAGALAAWTGEMSREREKAVERAADRACAGAEFFLSTGSGLALGMLDLCAEHATEQARRLAL
eukprot:1148096-Pelagomonas_calceolata.AAC.3